MKRTLEQDLSTFVSLHDRIQGGGDEYWTLNTNHALNKMVDTIPVSTFFLTSPLRERCANLSLTIDGEACGTYGAPDVKKLLAKAEAAGYGHKGETKFDTNVRLAYAIDGKRVGNENHDPYEFFEDHADAFTAWSGAASRYSSLKLYKLHIYPEGGKFDAHVDTPHGKGHIASAILTLGSTFTGGDLVVQHGGEERRLSGPLQFGAWYTDCVHFVEPVTSGTRVVLQFDVINMACELPPLPIEKEEEEEEEEEEEDDNNDRGFFYWNFAEKALGTPAFYAHLANLLKASMKKDKCNFALLLQHMYYLNGGLAEHVLKGSDKQLWDALKADGRFVLKLRPVVMRQTDKDEYGVGTLLEEGDVGEERSVTLIPGGERREKYHVVFNNPGAEHTGNEAMDPDRAYLAAAVVVKLKEEAVVAV